MFYSVKKKEIKSHAEFEALVGTVKLSGSVGSV